MEQKSKQEEGLSTKVDIKTSQSIETMVSDIHTDSCQRDSRSLRYRDLTRGPTRPSDQTLQLRRTVVGTVKLDSSQAHADDLGIS